MIFRWVHYGLLSITKWKKEEILGDSECRTHSFRLSYKIFTVEAAINNQVDTVYTTCPGNVLEGNRTYFKRQKPNGILVWCVVSPDGLRWPLAFIIGGVKVNSRVYQPNVRQRYVFLIVSYIRKSRCLHSSQYSRITGQFDVELAQEIFPQVFWQVCLTSIKYWN